VSPVRARRWALPAALAILAVVVLASCGDDGDKTPTSPPGVYNFSLRDVNPSSPSHGQMVSIQSFLGHPIVLYVGAGN